MSALAWPRRIALLGVLVAAALLVFLGRNPPPAFQTSSGTREAPTQPSGLPRLLDLGAGKCIPCKAMAPILDDLRRDYRGRMEVEFIDVWENRDAARIYRIGMIPTQIFYDGQGRELFRHEGFFSRQEILDTWARLGVPLDPANTP